MVAASNSPDLQEWVSDPLESAAQILQLFQYLPRAYLFIKERDGCFVYANKSFLSLHGVKRLEDLVGKRDFDFHPPALASQYIEEDQRVMASGRPLPDQIWLVMGYDRMPRWYVSSKVPLFDRKHAVIGIAGIMRPYDHSGTAPSEYRRLTPVMELVQAHYGEELPIARLAECAHLSISQLQREFRRLFGMSPGEYVMRVRLLMARRQLEESQLAVGDIALDCGFYDQSHFNRSFRRHVGMTPRGYRNRFTHGLTAPIETSGST